MEERYIASVDLGTSKIAVSVARIEGQNVQVVYYKESQSQGIRESYVFNPKKVETELRKAISDAQQELRIRIAKVVVGLPKYYVKQVTGMAKSERQDPDAEITEAEIRELKSAALESYPLADKGTEVLYGAVAQSFSTEDSINELESDIIGMTASTLEGNFKVFIGNRRCSTNIDNAFSSMGISIAKKYFTPGITAKAVLKDEQMENGVALIDLGAGVSSVTIFKGKIMRYYAAIPFGGNSVTSDIQSECNISFELAENIKKAFGACMPNKLSSHGEKIIQINDENDVPTTQVGVKYLSEIITCRMSEIIDALLYQIQLSGFSEVDSLRSGVVITGGGADLVNCANYIKEKSGYSVKIGTPRPFFSCEGCEGAKSASAATSMGMINSARNDRSLNCTSKPATITVETLKETPKPQKPKVTEYAATPAAPAPEVVSEPAPVVKPEEEKPQEPTPQEPQRPKSWGAEYDFTPARETKPAKVQEPVYEPVIEEAVAAAQEDENEYEGSVFEPIQTESQKPKRKKSRFKTIGWIGAAIKAEMNNLFDEMDKEEV